MPREVIQFNGCDKPFITEADRMAALQRVLFALKGLSSFDNFHQWDIRFTSEGFELSFTQEDYQPAWHSQSNKTRDKIEKIRKIFKARKHWIRAVPVLSYNEIDKPHDLFTVSLHFLRH